MRLALIGVAIGLASAFGLARVIATLLDASRRGIRSCSSPRRSC
jgi:hypothetical protein